MYCRKCGKPIPDDSVFCPYCGCAVDLTSSGADDSSLPRNQCTQAADTKRRRSRKRAARIALPLMFVFLLVVCALLGIQALKGNARDVRVQSSASTVPPTTVPETAGEPETTEASETAVVSATAEDAGQETDADPWIPCADLSEAEKLLGFGLELPEIVKDFDDPYVNAAPGCSNLWVIFRKDVLEHDPQYYSNVITVSKMISVQKYPSFGSPLYDASEYDTKLVKIGSTDVVLLLDNREVVEADWVEGEYGYSVIFENCGLTANTVVPVIAQIR